MVLGGKAQVCLNESLRVLKTYLYLFPDDRRADYKALQTLGLMQISDVYNLVYGGRLILSSRQKGKSDQPLLLLLLLLFASALLCFSSKALLV